MYCRFIYVSPHCLLSSLCGCNSLSSQGLAPNAEDFILLELMCGASVATWRRSVLRTKRPRNISMQLAWLDKTGTEVLERKLNSTNSHTVTENLKKKSGNKKDKELRARPEPATSYAATTTLTLRHCTGRALSQEAEYEHPSTDAKTLRRFSLRSLNGATVQIGHCSASEILGPNKSAKNRRRFACDLCHLVRINRYTTWVLPSRGGLWYEQTTPSQNVT